MANNNTRFVMVNGKRGFRRCLICGEPIIGGKAVGDTKIRDAKGRIIGDACGINGRFGYKHTWC